MDRRNMEANKTQPKLEIKLVTKDEKPIKEKIKTEVPLKHINSDVSINTVASNDTIIDFDLGNGVNYVI